MSDKKTEVWRERLASPLTWHYVGFGVLLVLVIALATRFALDWAATSSRTTDALAGKQVQLKAMDLQTAPLRGLDKRVALTRDEIRLFYADSGQLLIHRVADRRTCSEVRRTALTRDIRAGRPRQ